MNTPIDTSTNTTADTQTLGKNTPTGSAINKSSNKKAVGRKRYDDEMAQALLSTTPRATMRLQLHKDFTFADAQAQVPYFAKLGVSHLYLSPILTARAGSMHGYDVVDHSNVNPELGGETAFRDLVATLRKHEMGVIVDIVPNHMAIGGADNRLWLDVLEWGRNSRYANFFDIDWDVPDPALKNKILAPFLGNGYGEVLGNAEIQLQFDKISGRFSAQYYEHRFPINPTNYAQLLRVGGNALAPLAKHFRDASLQRIGKRGDDFSAACTELANSYASDAVITEAIDNLLLRFDCHHEAGRGLMHQLLERQHYRLSSWRNAADEINWRRFFDVIQLIGIRIQEPAAFEVVHATIFRLYAEGLIDGLRIDHIDGLADPRTYCRRLRTRLNRLSKERPADAPNGAAYFVVEKILAPEERLPREWQVDGTTGYSFMNDVSALLHDPNGEHALGALWTELSGRAGDFEAENKNARRRILQELLGSEFNSCALALHRIARTDPLTRDWSVLAIRRVLQELLVQFPIYRTYADARGRSEADDHIMLQAINAARPLCRNADRPLLDLFNAWLGGEAPHLAPARGRQLRLRAIARFQQLSSPLAAKSVEDTAFYRHGKLLSRNEVGSNPAIFANSPGDFHIECTRRAQYFPRAMLATATHDHKRGEDLRARLAVLSEIPERWADAVKQWVVINQPLKIAQNSDEQLSSQTKLTSQDLSAQQIAELPTATPQWPLGADEYMLYQMLVGAWPLDLAADDKSALQQLAERLQQWWLKALREAKQLSSWGEPNADYEEACQNFLNDVLDPSKSYNFLTQLSEFTNSIAAAGAVNGLSQTLIKLTAPGIPDIYQGCELWDFSLVDPDNRRPVDYTQRANLLAADSSIASMQSTWRSGAIKQFLIKKLLKLREENRALFLRGDYQALTVTGALAKHVFAFKRTWEGQTLIVAGLRLPAGLSIADSPIVDSDRWGDTELSFHNISTATDTTPAVKKWLNIFSSINHAILTSSIDCKTLFSEQPFAVLLSEK
ncbi:MAG: treY [Verrucomicrobiaceae bacterium]|nr:treY [Verrucomicrobiaceae bacterium]